MVKKIHFLVRDFFICVNFILKSSKCFFSCLPSARRSGFWRPFPKTDTVRISPSLYTSQNNLPSKKVLRNMYQTTFVRNTSQWQLTRIITRLRIRYVIYSTLPPLCLLDWFSFYREEFRDLTSSWYIVFTNLLKSSEVTIVQKELKPNEKL